MKLQYMCLDSTLDLWQPGHFECAALGFFYAVNLDMDNSLKWVFFKHGKRSDNKRYTAEV